MKKPPTLSKLMMLFAAVILSVCARERPAFGGVGSPPSPPQLAAEWTRENSVPLPAVGFGTGENLHFLDALIGKAHVVALGEPIHGTHEGLSLRNSLFEYSVEHLGVTALATESGFADSIAVDEYVHGHGSLTQEVVAAVFSFGAPGAYKENAELLEWMRAYNTRPGLPRKIRFYGLEMLGRWGWGSVPGQAYAGKPFDGALHFALSVDHTEAQSLSNRIKSPLAKLTTKGYESLTMTERNELTLAVADLVSLYERRHIEWVSQTSSLAYDRAFRNALNARNLNADLRCGGWWISIKGDRNQRDASSAENLRWVLDREGPNGKVFLFAHDAHIRKAPQQAPMGDVFTSLGQHLNAELGSDYVAIGTLTGDQDAIFPQNSVNAMLRKTGMPLFLTDLRKLPANGAIREWWNRDHIVYQEKVRFVLNPVLSFDALLYVNQTSPAGKFSTP